VRINDDARQAVVFFGVPGPDGIEYGGTGFMLCDHEEGILIPFLVTARHVAEALIDHHDTGFFIRVNTKDGKSHEIPVESADWAFHPDPTVDLAAINFSLSGKIYETIYYPLKDPSYGPDDRIAKYGSPNAVICGDPISIVGLFRLHHGKQRNVPVVHNGHIAALPDPNERIPIKELKTNKIVEAEVYLVEAQTLDGLSGSPVFTNESIVLNLGNKIHGEHPHTYGALVLLGLYIGSWTGVPGEILAKDRNFHGGIRVPIGMGSVVPAQKIVELIRGDAGLNAWRKAKVAMVKNERAMQQDSSFGDGGRKSVTQAEPDGSNPRHQEDFMSLLDAAAKVQSPKGRT
jgi:hypothetical protein